MEQCATRNEEMLIMKNIDELIEKVVDLYVREEDKQIRAEIEELNDSIKSSQKSFNEGGLPTVQTLKDFLSEGE